MRDEIVTADLVGGVLHLETVIGRGTVGLRACAEESHGGGGVCVTREDRHGVGLALMLRGLLLLRLLCEEMRSVDVVKGILGDSLRNMDARRLPE